MLLAWRVMKSLIIPDAIFPCNIRFSGGIITAAGIIMAVAFVALLGSKTVILNQTAFLLTGAVLVDTFIVRIFVVPILMAFTGDLSWWPRRDLPPDVGCMNCDNSTGD